MWVINPSVSAVKIMGLSAGMLFLTGKKLMEKTKSAKGISKTKTIKTKAKIYIKRVLISLRCL
jgi:hypothetical protein